jgi:hypothetical protein
MRALRARRLYWPLAALAVAILILMPATAWAVLFSAGPSVRVTPNTQVEFKWSTDVAWFGRVDVFDSPNATAPIFTQWAVDQLGTRVGSLHPVVTIPVAGPITPDTTLYFQVTAVDPGDTSATISSPTAAPWTPFFTGAQALSNVQATPGTTSAQISWQGNVIGLGRVEYGTSTSYDQLASDVANVTGHAFTLTGLQPATTYYYRLSNVHALDGDSLASSTGSFTTLSAFSDQFLQPLDQSTDAAHPIPNTGKNGKVISVKVRISQGGTALTDQNAPGPVTIAVSKLASCSNIAGIDPVESYADAGQSSAGTNLFRYDANAEAWMYGLDTKALGLVTGNCYRIDVSVAGTKITNAFAVFQPTK